MMAKKKEPRYKVMSAGALGYGVYDTHRRAWADGDGYKSNVRHLVAKKCAELNKAAEG